MRRGQGGLESEESDSEPDPEPESEPESDPEQEPESDSESFEEDTGSFEDTGFLVPLYNKSSLSIGVPLDHYLGWYLLLGVNLMEKANKNILHLTMPEHLYF